MRQTHEAPRQKARVGQVRYDVDLVGELERLAGEDEAAAALLAGAGQHRHAIYFYLQAVEKTVRARIFGIVDPANRHFRDYNRHHSLETSFDFFAQIVSPDPLKRAAFRERLDRIIPHPTQHESLHNSLRYPWFSEKYENYNVADFSASDSALLRAQFDELKQFLSEMERHR